MVLPVTVEERFCNTRNHIRPSYAIGYDSIVAVVDSRLAASRSISAYLISDG